jgi:hypothetical protein
MIGKKSTRAAEYAFASDVVKSPEFAILPAATRKAIQAHRSGLWGEKDTAHILDREFGAPDNDRHVVVHNLRLADGLGGFAQFDHILLSRFSRTAAIFESKNYAGRISKNNEDEWQVWYNGQRFPTDIPNPVAQVRRQRAVLEAWFRAKGHTKAFEKVGVFVVIPSDGSINRKAITGDVPLYKSDNVVAAWTEFGGSTPLSRLFSSGISGQHMLGIARQLIADHQPEEDIYIRLGIDPGSADPGPTVTPAQDTPAVATVPAQAPETQPVPLIMADTLPEPPPQIDEPSGTELETASIDSAPSDTPEPETRVHRKAKAGASVEVCAGIFERTLPDGRIAFRAAKDDELGKEALTSLCKGKAIWNPMFANWVCVPEFASEIRARLPNAIKVGRLP